MSGPARSLTVTSHAAQRYRERVEPGRSFREAQGRLRWLAATEKLSARAPLWLDRLATERGLRFLVGPRLREACGLDRSGSLVTVLTPEFPYDEQVGIRKPKRQAADQFDKRLQASYRDAERHGYASTRALLKMARDLGAVGAAKQLLAQSGWEDPLQRLRAVGALDLSIEAHVLDPRFRHLFSSEEIDVARQRLAQLGFDDS